MFNMFKSKKMKRAEAHAEAIEHNILRDMRKQFAVDVFKLEKEKAEKDLSGEFKQKMSLVSWMKVGDEVGFMGAKSTVLRLQLPEFYCIDDESPAIFRVYPPHVGILYVHPATGMEEVKLEGDEIKVLRKLN